MRFNYPHVDSPEADVIVDEALGVLERLKEGPHTLSEDDEEVILEAALIIKSRRLAKKEGR
jgi:hypothetical protein